MVSGPRGWYFVWNIARILIRHYFFIPRPRHNSCRKEVCRNAWFRMAASMFYRSWDRSKNPCPCRNRTFPNSVHHQNLDSIQPVVSCFPGLDDAASWEMCDFPIGMGSCYMLKCTHRGINTWEYTPAQWIFAISPYVGSTWAYQLSSGMIKWGRTWGLYTDCGPSLILRFDTLQTVYEGQEWTKCSSGFTTIC